MRQCASAIVSAWNGRYLDTSVYRNAHGCMFVEIENTTAEGKK